MRNRKNILYTGIIISAAVLALIFLIVYHLFSGIPDNPAETVGNTAGNINNYALFCENNGTVYFSNSFDNGCLYSMDAEEGNIRKLSNVVVCNLITGGDYLYYFQLGTAGVDNLKGISSNRSFNRYHLKSKKQTGLTKDVIIKAQLVGNYLYLLADGDNGPLFYKMKTDRSGKTDLAHYQINPACAVDGVIYYNGTQDNHALYALDTATDIPSLVYDSNLWNPIIYGDYVYYMDVSNHYRLCRYSLSGKQEEVLTDDRIDCFNIGSGFIYFQKNGAEPQLKCMRVDGTDEMVIAQGNYTHINMTSQYVYFQEFSDSITMYHSYIGSTQYDRFTAAEQAAMDYSSM